MGLIAARDVAKLVKIRILSSNANFDFQNSSNANANSGIYFIRGKSECSELV